MYTQPIEPDAFQGEPVTCDLRWTGSRMPLALAGGGAQLATYTLAPQGTPKLAAEAAEVAVAEEVARAAIIGRKPLRVRGAE